MRVELAALRTELPLLLDLDTKELCERLAALGFPVDAVEPFEGTTVLEVDITANRGDAMSHRGLARDLGARLAADLSSVSYLPLLEATEPYRPILLESEACPVYASAVLELEADQFTPTEVQAFLRAMGSTPKNLAAVDASNELIHRYGHPTHAFDADCLEGPIAVRWACAGEKLITLDGVARSLDCRDLVIADTTGPIALAGVMGGESTKVTEATRRVLLESAWFDPKAVRLMARRHCLHTDASHRFGRGADPGMARVSRDLLLRRIEAWAGAKVLGVWSVGKAPPERAPIPLRKKLLERIAGEPVSLAEASRSLQRLGCRVASEPGLLSVTPPSWRHDLGIPEDLAEEVLRLRGYEKIPVALPPLEGLPQSHAPRYRQAQALARRLAHLGFLQTVTFGFVSPEEDAQFSLTPSAGRVLSNPLGREFSVMRGSLLPSLRRVALANLRQGAASVRIFEVAPIYASAPAGPVETSTLGVVLGGMLGGEDPYTPARPVSIADLLAVAMDLGAQRETLDIQEIDPGLFAFEVSLERLPLPPDRIIPRFTAFSRFPSAERDLSLLVRDDQAYTALQSAVSGKVAGTAGASFQDVRCVDVFRGKTLPLGHQAWLLRFRFQHPDRTLTGEEVDGWMTAALEAANSLGAELRR
jgi:phenylalanyl-tRNA synthetase beta chain